MKNIQVIDGAENCTYDIFQLEDKAFNVIFPNEQDIEFIEDLLLRVGEREMLKLVNPMWKRRIPKKDARGIHGTLFYQLEFKKKYYPSKKEDDLS